LGRSPNSRLTFRVLDSPVINAFALPGGYVYVTRGILAHMNNESELAVVLGHEIGHVTARHGASRQTNATLAGLGLGIGGVFVPQVAQYSPVLEQSLGLLFLKYGRDDEHQSDELGVTYSLAAGFDPEAGSKFFEVLDRQMQESGHSLPGWLSTHPDPGDRVQRTRDLARQAKSTQSGPWEVGEAALKKRLDGIVFGDNPRHGFVRGNEFLHPDLQFAVTFPEGWQIQNMPAAVLSGDAEGTAQVQMTLENVEGATLEKYIADLATSANAKVVESANKKIGGASAREALLEVSDEGKVQQVLVTCIQRAGDASMFRFLGFAASMQASRPVLQNVAASWRQLTDKDALAMQPNRLRLKTIDKPVTLQAAVQNDSSVPVDVGTLAMLNNLQANSSLAKGFVLKIVQGSYKPGN
jgi:predicted Zn-dependent protease